MLKSLTGQGKMDKKFIKERSEKEWIEVVDVELKLKEEEIKRLLNIKDYKFNFLIDKRIGDIIICKED